MLNPSQVTSLAKGEVEVESGAQVLVEQGPVVLTQDLNVALAGSTQDEVVDAPAVTIPAGTTVCAYYIHFDVLPGGSSSQQIATMTFSGPVLGHTDGSEDQLRDTDDFELAGIDYAIVKGAGAGQTDDLWVNGNTANFNFRTHGNNRDDVRLFVACS